MAISFKSTWSFLLVNSKINVFKTAELEMHGGPPQVDWGWLRYSLMVFDSAILNRWADVSIKCWCWNGIIWYLTLGMCSNTMYTIEADHHLHPIQVTVQWFMYKNVLKYYEWSNYSYSSHQFILLYPSSFECFLYNGTTLHNLFTGYSCSYLCYTKICTKI